MEEYQNNSHAFRAKQAAETARATKVDKVVSSPVKIKKKNGLQRYLDSQVPEGTRDFKTHVIKNILWPIIKDGAFEVVCTLFGKPKAKSSGRAFIDKVSYGSFFNQNRSSSNDRVGNQFRSGFDGLDSIILANRGDAEMVLSTMDDVIEKYGEVTVGALYDMLDETCPYTCERYGWKDLSSAKVVSVREGYLLDLPRPMVLK